MSNGYLLADANSLVYAYRAGGPDLLDEYISIADGGQRKLAVTRTVLTEIEDGPLGKELLQYLADRDVPVLPAPETEQRLREGKIPKTSSGEVSMLEVAAQEHTQGRATRIWADDRYFDSEQIMRKNPGAQRTMSAALLDEAYEQQFIDANDYQKFRAGYQVQGAFIDSARLNSFRYDFSTQDVSVDASVKAVSDPDVPTQTAPAPDTPTPPVADTPQATLPEDAPPRVPPGQRGFIMLNHARMRPLAIFSRRQITAITT
jgi:hypothetical protein